MPKNCLLTFIIGLIVGATLTVIVFSRFVRPVVSDKEIRQAKLDVQARCEDNFATFPNQRGKILVEGIEKCKVVAGLKNVGGKKK